MLAEKVTTQMAAGAKRLIRMIRTHLSTVQATVDDRLHRIATDAALLSVQTTETTAPSRRGVASRTDIGHAIAQAMRVVASLASSL